MRALFGVFGHMVATLEDNDLWHIQKQLPRVAKEALRPLPFGTSVTVPGVNVIRMSVGDLLSDIGTEGRIFNI